MAFCERDGLVLVILLLPVISLAYRPFRIPTNLFTPGLKTAHLPEGAREITWQPGDAQSGIDMSDLQPSGERFSRTRRNAPASPSPSIVESNFPKEPNDANLYKHWSGNMIILLAKKKDVSSNVYLSSDYGKKWTKLNSKLNGGKVFIDQVYVSQVKPTLCFLTDVKNKYIFITSDYVSFKKYGPLAWKPSFIAFHPKNRNRIMGYDKDQQKLFLSINGGVSFGQITDNVRTFWWGVPGLDADDVIFIDQIKAGVSPKKYKAVRVKNFAVEKTLLDDIDELEFVKNYMFATQTLSNGKTTLKVSYNRGKFVDAKFPVTENNRDYFVYDINNDQVFVVINHFKNESNLYLSDVGGAKYTLSLPRVLYHNPKTDVSSQWLRNLVKHPFVDVYKVNSMKGVYVATQLTPGPVGRRHLLSMITYNKGASWTKIRSPTRDTKGLPIYCYMPSCSLHFNLKYGSVYRISPSENLLSSDSAPGLVLALGVASTNLKIHPDTFLSTDGGLNWKRVLRGKHQYAFGNYGGAIVASYFGRHTNTLRYSTNGGESFQSATFSKQMQVQDIITETGETLPYFLVYGSPIGKQPWKIYHVNLTTVLGNPCQQSDFMYWVPGTNINQCELGRADNYTIRNWTKTCYLDTNHNVPKVQTNCPCTADDFECDFGFEQNVSHFVCRPVAGEDLDSDLIPNNCPEGSTYKRSRGYRKIPGDTCVGGEEARFLPKDTPCPIRKLSGLKVTTTPNIKVKGVTTNQAVTLTASLDNGYIPHVTFGWDFGDGSVKNGTGQSYTQITHSFAKPGRYVIVLTVTNTRSILISRVQVNVEETLTNNNVDVSFHPSDPTVAQTVAFMTNIIGLTRKAAGQLTYTWTIDRKTYQTGWQSFFKVVFNTSKIYTVTVNVKNTVSSVNKDVSVKVSKDIRPLNVKAVSLGPTAVEVKWTAPLEPARYITGFKVFKSTKRLSDFQECDAVDSITLFSLVRSLIPSTTYYFKVLAFTKNAEGAFSEVVSAKTNASNPGPPRNLRAYPLSSTSIRVEWKAPKNDYGRIKSYVLYWSAVGQSPSQLVTLSAASRRYDLVKLTQDTEYTFRLIAKYASGQSFAGPVQAKSNTSKPVLPPRDFKEISNNGTCTNLLWSAPLLQTGSSREFPAKGYKIYVSGKLKVTVSVKYAKVCGFTPGKTYVVEILAFSVVGGGPKAKLTLTFKAIKSSPPINVRSTAMTAYRIKVQWEAPLSPNGEINSYTIYQRKPVPSEAGIIVTGSTFSQVINGLTPYTQYTFVVVATNQAGESKFSQETIVLTHEEIPSAPEFIKAEVIEPVSATIRLTWSRPAHPNGKITGYEVVWGKTSISDEQYSQNKQEIVGNIMTYTFGHLYSGTEYTFMVAAKNGAGRSLSYSNHTQQFTRTAIDGTKRLRIQFQGKQDTSAKNFKADFISAVARQARISPIRVAALKTKAILVEFDIMPNLRANGTLLGATITSLNTSFSVGSAKTVTGSVRVLFTYNSVNPTTTDTPQKGVMGAQSSERTSEKKNLALIIVLTCVGLLLLAGLIFAASFYYRRYKPLEQHFSNMSSIYRTDNDEVNVAYPSNVMTGNDREHPTKPKKNAKQHKTEEKMPLGEHDELALA